MVPCHRSLILLSKIKIKSSFQDGFYSDPHRGEVRAQLFDRQVRKDERERETDLEKDGNVGPAHRRLLRRRR